MSREDKPTLPRRPASGIKSRRTPEAVAMRRRYTGATGATIGDVPEREAFDRGARVVK
jgi:hypothetical protein